MSDNVLKIADKLGAQIVYKTSFDKANRTSLTGYRGVELDEALKIFQEVKETTGLPMLTDIHTPEQCRKVGVSGVFMETHQDPDTAPSDGPNMAPLAELESLMSGLIRIHELRQELQV